MNPRLLASCALALSCPCIALLAAPKKPAAAKPDKHAASGPGALTAPVANGSVVGWLDWRGPAQNGTSPETGLPDKVEAKSALWTAEFPGQSAPVIANGKLYINGYVGDGAELREATACFDAESGKQLWQHLENDFLSDTIYLRYATSSPTVDAETGNVYVQGTQGLFTCFTSDGKVLWQRSMMEEFGRLTFPNARTATPLINEDLVITRGITSGWGANGPAGDRIFAFDKKTGELVWLSSPAERPQDNTFSRPLLTGWDGKDVLITAAGDSSVVGVNVRNGDPIFRFPVAKAGAKGGINAGVLRYKDSLLVIHESENIDTSEVGRSAAYKIPSATPPEPGKPQVFTGKELELWRNPLGNLASSPCLVGNRMYEVTGVGELACIDADTGKIVWRKKLGVEQRQSSPFYADGKLYVAFYIAGAAEQKAPAPAPAAPPAGAKSALGSEVVGEAPPSSGGDGELFIIKPGEKGPEILSRTILEGRCYGSPIAYNGKLYVQTDRKLYCFGKKGNNPAAKTVVWPDIWKDAAKPTEPARLQIVPNEVLLRPGGKTPVRARTIDANGFVVADSVDVKTVKFDRFIPPTALVKAHMNGAFSETGELAADPEPVPSAGAFQGVLKAGEKEITGTMRGRVLPDLPMKIDFEGTELTEMTGPGIGKEPQGSTVPQPGPAAPGAASAAPTTPPPGPTTWNVTEEPTPFAYPPLAWNSARFRFEIRKAPGEGENLGLCKTIDNKLFQRGQIFIGHPDMKNYTLEADVLTEGNKRKMSEIGLINQRYRIIVKANSQQLEVNSNEERLKVAVPFAVSPNVWYRLKTRVDVAEDGSGMVRGKVWKKGEAEPDAWSIEVPHQTAHPHGAPGLYSFTPQEQRAWIDNITATAN